MSNCMTSDSMWEQTTLFAPPPITGTPAISLFDNTTHSSEKPSEWMKRLVPDGEYVVMVGAHPLVMRKTKLTADEVPEGHQFKNAPDLPAEYRRVNKEQARQRLELARWNLDDLLEDIEDGIVARELKRIYNEYCRGVNDGEV